jgi:hypothetical protein
MPNVIVPMVMLAALGLAACDDSSQEQQRTETTPGAVALKAREVAEAQVRARLRIVGAMNLRAVQVYRQQFPDAFAVCGQINPTGAANDPFLPWVAVVTTTGDGESVRPDLYLGASNAEASRVYIEMLDRCFDGGGPKPGQARAQRALPPLPADSALTPPTAPSVPTPSPGLSGPGVTAQTPSDQPQSTTSSMRSVTTTAAHPVNIRAHPGGDGAVVRIVPRASELRVFGEAPGGWFQVGEEQPFGWVHGSMLGR